MQRAPSDVLPNQPKKERVLNPTPYPSAHVRRRRSSFRIVHALDAIPKQGGTSTGVCFVLCS